MARHIRRLCASFFVLEPLLLFLILSVSTGQPLSTLSLPIAGVSDTLNPDEIKSFSFTVPKDLYDSLLHVVVNAAAPDSDRLDLTIDDHFRTGIQGEWWNTLGSLAAGDHTLTATPSSDAANPLTFTVEFYEIPTPPFTIGGTFPAVPYNNLVYLDVNVTTPGDYLISAAASAGNFAIFIEGHEIDVSGLTELTLQFTEAQTYVVVLQHDILGTGEATTWSITIRPTTATTTSSTTSTLTETTSSTSSTMTSTTSTETSSSVSSSVTTSVTESSTLTETTSSTSSTMTSTMSSSMSTDVSAATTSEMTPTSSEETTTLIRPPRCVIATAAYGSEMAPEVVYMRFVRDELIGSTPTGRVLVGAFNVFYYSWSPVFAREIAASQVLRAIFRVLLLPLVWIVHATALVFTTLAGMTGNTDLASVLAFLLAALMAVTVYIALPTLAGAKLHRKVQRLTRLRMFSMRSAR